MAKKNSPVVVREPVRMKGFGYPITIDGYQLDGTIDHAIERLQKLKEEYPDKNLELSWEQEKYEDSYSFHLYEIRPETEKERKVREDAEKARQDRLRAKELEQLEALKKKYPDS